VAICLKAGASRTFAPRDLEPVFVIGIGDPAQIDLAPRHRRCYKVGRGVRLAGGANVVCTGRVGVVRVTAALYARTLDVITC